jgi:hypothetical protein
MLPSRLALIVWPVCAAFHLVAAPLTVTVLSSRPDMVSGGDALIEIRSEGAPAGKVQVRLNDRDVSQLFHADASRGSLVGLVDGLRNGANTIVAKAGSRVASLQVVNHPITGPIVSGDHLKPFVCNTEESGLGAPLDADCSAQMKIEYFYRSNETP